MEERSNNESRESSFSRRDFLKAGLAGAAVVGLGTIGKARETRASAQVQKSELKALAQKNMIGVENATFPSFTPDMADLDEDGIRWDVQQAIKHGFFSKIKSKDLIKVKEALIKRIVSSRRAQHASEDANYVYSKNNCIYPKNTYTYGQGHSVFDNNSENIFATYPSVRF